jgi:hypothetical protein
MILITPTIDNKDLENQEVEALANALSIKRLYPPLAEYFLLLNYFISSILSSP